LPDRERELDAIQYLIETINPKVVRPPEEVHIEGGDVMLWNNYFLWELIKEATIKNTLLHEPIYKVCSTSGFISK
jgi:hypothetical protein